MSPSTRQWCGAVLAAVLMSPAVLALAEPRLHDCTDHVCQCTRPSGPARGSAAQSCHAPSRSDVPRCEMRGSCAHEAPLLVAGRPYLFPRNEPQTISRTVEILPAAAVPRLRAGILRIDSPPPRHS